VLLPGQVVTQALSRRENRSQSNGCGQELATAADRDCKERYRTSDQEGDWVCLLLLFFSDIHTLLGTRTASSMLLLVLLFSLSCCCWESHIVSESDKTLSETAFVGGLRVDKAAKNPKKQERRC
jgi:hypothetical protein